MRFYRISVLIFYERFTFFFIYVNNWTSLYEIERRLFLTSDGMIGIVVGDILYLPSTTSPGHQAHRVNPSVPLYLFVYILMKLKWNIAHFNGRIMSNNLLQLFMVFSSMLELTKDHCRPPKHEGDSETKIGNVLALSNLGNYRRIGNNIKLKV